MDYFSPATPNTLLARVDPRKNPRKPLKRSVSVGTTEHGIVRGYAYDISVGGLSVMIPVALAVDSLCAIRFDLFIDGNLVRISGTGTVAYSCCCGVDGFRSGLKFKPQDSTLQSVLEAFVAQ